MTVASVRSITCAEGQRDDGSASESAAYCERHDESKADVRKILLQLERAKVLYEELGAQAK